MAKLSVAVLFLLFTLSVARTPSTIQENDVSKTKPPNYSPENDASNRKLPDDLPADDVTHLKLPSDRTETDSETKSDEQNPETKYAVHTVPLTLVQFRPINRRFRLRSNLPFRLCRHHSHHAHGLNPTAYRQIPYGNDFDSIVFHVGMHQFPADRVHFRRHHMDEENDDHEEEEEKKKKSKFLTNRDDQIPQDRFDDDEVKKISKFLASRFDPISVDRFNFRHRHEADEEEKKISKFLTNRGDSIPFNRINFRRHHNDDDHEEKKIWKFLHDDEAAEKGSKLYAKHNEDHHYSFDTKHLRKRFNRRPDGDEQVEKGKLVNKKEMQKGGIMKNIRKFLHNYFD